jgi:hypothetical protein
MKPKSNAQIDPNHLQQRLSVCLSEPYQAKARKISKKHGTGKKKGVSDGLRIALEAYQL